MPMKSRSHPLVVAANVFLGYTARPNANEFLIFSNTTGEFQWDGSFIDAVVAKTASANTLPKHANTTNALSFYVRNGWVRRAPKPGDLVFFSHAGSASVGRYLSPRVGVVSSTVHWRGARSFKSFEGQTHSGMPRASRELTGVYERTHYETDVLFFVRIPKHFFVRSGEPTPFPVPASARVVRPAHLERCSTVEKSASAKPDHRVSTELVQVALAEHPSSRLRNANRRVFDAHTRSALASFQRFVGFPVGECNGVPNSVTLELLSLSPFTSTKFRVES